MFRWINNLWQNGLETDLGRAMQYNVEAFSDYTYANNVNTTIGIDCAQLGTQISSIAVQVVDFLNVITFNFPTG